MRFLKALLWGVVSLVGGFSFSAFFGAVFNGFSKPYSELLGCGLYLCFLIAFCTCLGLSKRRDGDDDRPSD